VQKQPFHDPVLLAEVLSLLDPVSGESVLDVTLGLGGHALAFLKKIGQKGSFVGMEADAENLLLATNRLSSSPAAVKLIHGNFRDIASFTIDPVDILFADLGLSSPHIDDATRGFSFREDAPLDLRFDRTRGLSAAQWLSDASEASVRSVLREYGELAQAHQIARSLCAKQPQTTSGVQQAVEQACGWRARSVLPQVFQALRIAVNDELVALDTLLSIGPTLLLPGGRMGIISYHSLEDRRVKQSFRTLVTPEIDPRTGGISIPAPFALITRKPVAPSSEEVSINPRARSAKFRAIRKMRL